MIFAVTWTPSKRHLACPPCVTITVMSTYMQVAYILPKSMRLELVCRSQACYEKGVLMQVELTEVWHRYDRLYTGATKDAYAKYGSL